MDPIAAVPDFSAQDATALSQSNLQQQVDMKVQKMAMDSGAQIAEELLKSLGVGANLNTTA